MSSKDMIRFPPSSESASLSNSWRLLIFKASTSSFSASPANQYKSYVGPAKASNTFKTRELISKALTIHAMFMSWSQIAIYTIDAFFALVAKPISIRYSYKWRISKAKQCEKQAIISKKGLTSRKYDILYHICHTISFRPLALDSCIFGMEYPFWNLESSFRLL